MWARDWLWFRWEDRARQGRRGWPGCSESPRLWARAAEPAVSSTWLWAAGVLQHERPHKGVAGGVSAGWLGVHLNSMLGGKLSTLSRNR